MQSVLYFDIDFTLLNTEVLMHTFHRKHILALLAVSDEQLAEAEAAYHQTLEKSTDFDPRAFTQLLAQRFGTDADKLLAVFADPKANRESLYPETRAEIAYWHIRGFRLGVYSEGLLDFQMHKLTDSGMLPFFEPELIHIARRKLAPDVVAGLEPGGYVIDDNLEYIDGLAGTAVTPVWINRKDSRVHPHALTIKTLAELRQHLT